MPGPETELGTDPSLNHPLTMSYMGAGSGGEKRVYRPKKLACRPVRALW